MAQNTDEVSFRAYEGGHCENCGQYRDTLVLATLSSGGESESMVMCPTCAMRLKRRVDQYNARQAAAQPVPQQTRQPVPQSVQTQQTPQAAAQPVQPQTSAYDDVSASQPDYAPQSVPANIPAQPVKPATGSIVRRLLICLIPATVVVVLLLVIIAAFSSPSSTGAKISRGEAVKAIEEGKINAFHLELERFCSTASKFDSISIMYLLSEEVGEFDSFEAFKKEYPDIWQRLVDESATSKQEDDDDMPTEYHIKIHSIRPYTREEIDEYYENHIPDYGNYRTFFKRQEIKGMCDVNFSMSGVLNGEAFDSNGSCVVSKENGRWRIIIKELD